MGHRWLLLTHSEPVKSVMATNARPAHVPITVENAEPLAMCLGSTATLSGVQWDSLDAPTHVVSIVGTVTATQDCGVKQY